MCNHMVNVKHGRRTYGERKHSNWMEQADSDSQCMAFVAGLLRGNNDRRVQLLLPNFEVPSKVENKTNEKGQRKIFWQRNRRRNLLMEFSYRWPWATSSTLKLSASAGRRTVAMSSFSRRVISCSSISICFRRSTTVICISSVRIFWRVLAACNSYANCASAF